MDSHVPVLLLSALAAGAFMVGLWAWSRWKRWRRKDPYEVERLRCLDVNRRGRIAAAEIVDVVEPEAAAASRQGVMIVYKYEVAGVTYEVSQDLSAFPAPLAATRSLTSQTASIKYDPRAPTNSIIACEEWNGIEGVMRVAAPRAST